MMRLSFTTRLTIAIALGGICTVLLVILALCGGSSASAREAEARSAYTADAFELEYGAIYTGNPVDISAVNGDGKSDVLRAFVLVAKDTVHVTGLTVVTDRLTSAARLYLTANKEDEEEGEEEDWTDKLPYYDSKGVLRDPQGSHKHVGKRDGGLNYIPPTIRGGRSY